MAFKIEFKKIAVSNLSARDIDSTRIRMKLKLSHQSSQAEGREFEPLLPLQSNPPNLLGFHSQHRQFKGNLILRNPAGKCRKNRKVLSVNCKYGQVDSAADGGRFNSSIIGPLHIKLKSHNERQYVAHHDSAKRNTYGNAVHRH